MFRKAYSYIESVVAVAILIIAVVPLINLNSKQINVFYNISVEKKYLNFFDSLYLHLKLTDIEKIKSNEGELLIEKIEDIKNTSLFENYDFYDFEEMDKKFLTLNVNIKREDINFYIENETTYIINLKLKLKGKEYATKLIRFE